MTKIYSYAIMLLLAALIVGAGNWYVDSLKADLATARKDLATEQTNASNCATALVQANDATAKAEDRAKLMQVQAQTLIDSADGKKAKNSASAAVFAVKVSKGAKAPDCQAVLEAQLCAALSGY